MERLTLVPKTREIVVNSGSTDGAVDLFCYGPEMEPAARTLGSLCVLGWRQAETNTMGYMVSLIAALARREYYAQPSQPPREAFTRTLRKINEVVEEFFKSSGVDLAVGIFAVAGGSIMVSKLDKFKVLLARDGQVIDILNNIALFSKEHLDRRRFSSIISGSVQPGDRLLAYYPAKSVVARERLFKGWLLSGDGSSTAMRFAQLGQEHPAFAGSFVHVDMIQEEEPARETPEPEPEPLPVQPAADTAPIVPNLAWSPRQSSPVAASASAPDSPPVVAAAAPVAALDTEQEVPHMLPTEFSLGTRQNRFGRTLGRFRFIRLDGRGKAILLALAALIIAGGALTARSLLFTSPEDEQRQSALSAVAADLELARSRMTTAPADARGILVRALGSLGAIAGFEEYSDAARLSADIMAVMDELDHAQTAQASVLAQLDPKLDRIMLATWSSASATLWAVTASDTSGTSVIRITVEGFPEARTALPEGTQADLLVGHGEGVLVVDSKARTVHRVAGGAVTSYVIPTQESIQDAAQFADSLYVLTDASILKVSDLDTIKPVTKQWLTSQDQLSPGASRILVDGNIYTIDRDGLVATYYKGKRTAAVPTTLGHPGDWRMVRTASPDEFGVACAERMRVYIASFADGSLLRTLKLDSEQPLVLMNEGPDGSVIAVTKDNRIWRLQ